VKLAHTKRVATGLAIAATVALIPASPVTAGTRSIVPADGVVLEGAASTWDADLDSLACDQTGFTPVGDGTFKAKDDAFDNGLVMGVDGTGFDDADGTIPGGPLAKETIATSTNDFAPVQVHRWDRVLPKSDTLRTFVAFKNTAGTAQALTIEWDSDLGSDSSTEVRGSSSGDSLYQKGDRWAVSSDDPTNPGDPVVTFVLFGKGANEKTATVVQGLGALQTCFTIDFDISVPAGATRYLMFFTELHGKNGAAVTAARKFDNVGPASPLLVGITNAAKPKILNWNI